MHAATDIGSAVDWLQRQVVLSSDENGCLAVLHNRNKMVATFGNSEWVTQSEGAVQSKSVTSCAGMTHFVLLAQTKVGFLSGGRSMRMKELPQKEVLSQLEEAYARATVALTRAQKLCIIMGPLDMRGLLGAATAIGCLKYGAGVCGVHADNPSAEVFLKEGSLNEGPDDSALPLLLRPSHAIHGWRFSAGLFFGFVDEKEERVGELEYQEHKFQEASKSITQRVKHELPEDSHSFGSASSSKTAEEVLRLAVMQVVGALSQKAEPNALVEFKTLDDHIFWMTSLEWFCFALVVISLMAIVFYMMGNTSESESEEDPESREQKETVFVLFPR